MRLGESILLGDVSRVLLRELVPVLGDVPGVPGVEVKGLVRRDLLTPRQRLAIAERYEEGFETAAEIGLDYGVEERTVYRVVKEHGLGRFRWSWWTWGRFRRRKWVDGVWRDSHGRAH